MGYDELSKEFAYPAEHPEFASQFSKRESEFLNLINDIKFYQETEDITLIVDDDIAKKLCSAYYALCYGHVKPVINDKINKYKMASLTELLLNKEQILSHPQDSKNRSVNAQFSMMAAFSIIDCMIQDATKPIFAITNNAILDKRIDQMIEDHRLWLENKNINEMPIFINAQFYEAMQIIQAYPVQIGGF